MQFSAQRCLYYLSEEKGYFQAIRDECLQIRHDSIKEQGAQYAALVNTDVNWKFHGLRDASLLKLNGGVRVFFYCKKITPKIFHPII